MFLEKLLASHFIFRGFTWDMNLPFETSPVGVPEVQKKTKSKFTPEEDTKLCELVGRFGEDNWKVVSLCMKTRTVRQCRERWRNYLSPRVVNAPWSAAEDFLLEQKFREMGPHWKAIASFFPMRTDIQVKNRILLKQRQFERIARSFPLQFPMPVQMPARTAPKKPKQREARQEEPSSESNLFDLDTDFELDCWFDIASQLEI